MKKLLFLPGWAHSQDAFQALIAHLGSGVDSTCLSLPSLLSAAAEEHEEGDVFSSYAHGLKHQILANNQRSTIIGWSMGGMIALEAAVLLPDKIEKLVLISTTLCFPASSLCPWGVPEAELRALMQGLRQNRERCLRRFFHFIAGTFQEKDSVIAEKLKALSTVSDEALLHGLQYLQQAKLDSFVSNIRCPLLLIHAKDDPIISWQAANHLDECCQKYGRISKLLLLPDGAHILPQLRAKLLANAIHDWLL